MFSTLAHYLGGAPAETDVVPAEIAVRTPGGETTTMRRWVLQEHVRTKVLGESGFTGIGVDTLPSPADAPRSVATLLIRAVRRA
ncbi:hypothetical protein [Streptomyces sp. enrichment culture]|uniref:hypothetical protein n=1 Tax=Streptomyces sp. enrichment culture TaxID=1795815 RepID=UPI003F57AB24